MSLDLPCDRGLSITSAVHSGKPNKHILTTAIMLEYAWFLDPATFWAMKSLNKRHLWPLLTVVLCRTKTGYHWYKRGLHKCWKKMLDVQTDKWMHIIKAWIGDTQQKMNHIYWSIHMKTENSSYAHYRFTYMYVWQVWRWVSVVHVLFGCFVCKDRTFTRSLHSQRSVTFIPSLSLNTFYAALIKLKFSKSFYTVCNLRPL